MSQDWDIKPRGDACSECEKQFADKQNYHAMLTFTSKEGYTRADYCNECWPKHQKDATPTSAWQGTFLLPPPPPEEALKKETAETMLRRLMQDEDNTKINAIYILAVMLERKRILVERDIQTKDDGITIRVYEHRQTGETFLIPEPHLHLDELEHVQEEVVTLLGDKPRNQEAEKSEPVVEGAVDAPKDND